MSVQISYHLAERTLASDDIFLGADLSKIIISILLGNVNCESLIYDAGMKRPLCCCREMTIGYRFHANENFWFCFKCDREIPREVKVKKKKIPILSLFSTEL